MTAGPAAVAMPTDVPLTLPLFPLHAVLFPGGLLPLRVFEQRYLGMAKRCLRDDTPFGVCLIDEGAEVMTGGAGVPTFAGVGTTARIVHWDMPELGILELRAVGQRRFRILAHEVEPDGLLVGRVEPLAEEPALPLPEAFRSLAWIVEAIAAEAAPGRFPEPRAFGDAAWIGHRLAEALPLPLPLRQEMLAMTDPVARLERLASILREHGVGI